MDVWYYARAGEQKGPVDRDELQRLITSGAVRTTDYVWTDGMDDWLPANRVSGLVTAPLPGTSPAPAPDTRDENDDDGEPIPNYLVWAILVTLCCCLPGGIVSIVYSVQANSQRNAGSLSEARRSAERARNWLIWSAILGALATAVSVILPALQAFMSEIQ